MRGRGDPLWRDDVGRAFDWLGDAWASALHLAGVTGVSARRQGALVDRHGTRHVLGMIAAPADTSGWWVVGQLAKGERTH